MGIVWKERSYRRFLIGYQESRKRLDSSCRVSRPPELSLDALSEVQLSSCVESISILFPHNQSS